MSSCLSGRTTEPVIRNRTTKVTTTTIASTSGRWSTRLSWRSTKSAVKPGHERVARRLARGVARRGPGCASLSGGASEIASTTPRRRPRARCGGSTAATPGTSLDLGATRCAAVGPPPSTASWIGRVAEGREVGAQRVVDLARARRLGQHLRVDRGELDLEEGDPERDQERGARDRDPARDAHHEAREPVPEALLAGRRVALGAALQERGRERVDPRARAARGSPAGRSARSPPRSARPASRRAPSSRGTAAGRRAARRARRRRSARRRGPCAPPSPSSAASPRGPGPRAGDLLAVARDDEQAVVDRQPEPEAGDQVEGEDRDRAELAGDPQHQEGADDREAADQQRQQRGDEAAEEEQREQEQEREGVAARPCAGPPRPARSPAPGRPRRRRP